MKSLILAAGLGTRLRPLTNKIPKALIKIKEKTLLELVVERLKKFGFNEVIINVHHLGDEIVEFVKRKNNFGIKIDFSREEEILGTGGGLKKAEWFLNGDSPFLVHNVDVLSDIDLGEMYQSHLNSGFLSTLAVKKRETNRYLLFNKENCLVGWENKKTGEIKIVKKSEGLKHLAFSGIQVVSPEIFELMPKKDNFSIIDLYLDLASEHKIGLFEHPQNFWIDVGKKETLDEAREMVEKIGLEN